jgi:hypothetical protein
MSADRTACGELALRNAADGTPNSAGFANIMEQLPSGRFIGLGLAAWIASDRENDDPLRGVTRL